MPTPEKPYQIGVKTTGVAEVGYVRFINGRTNDYKIVKMNSTYETVTNLTKLTSDGIDKNPNNTHTNYAVGDVILLEVSGNYSGSSTTHTVGTKGGVTIKISGVDISTTNAPIVSIG